jgi:NAD(P)-dependent dehydrogenase (short-subunit alcohol dehydrogenase family)
MKEGGSIITISSLTARLPGPALGVYSAARAGIDYAIRVAALEYGPQRIRFNSIAAGLIRTDMTDLMFQDTATEERFIPEIPLRRMGTIDDIAEAALWLADEKASGFVTGQLLDLSGGQQMGHLPG